VPSPSALLLLAADPALAPDSGGVPIGFRIFLALVALGGLSIAAGSPLGRRLHRNRAVAALAAGGWFAVLAGAAIGPAGLDVIDAAIFAEVRPLLVVALGWVGLIVGLQLRLRVLQAVPKVVWRWVLVDAAVSASIAIALGLAACGWWIEGFFELAAESPGLVIAIVPAIAALAASNLGWAPETRSLRIELSDRTRRIAVLVSAGAGLASVVAVATLGLTALPIAETTEAVSFDARLGLVRLGVLAGIAVLAGTAARFLLGSIERNSPQMLVVLLGLVCLVGGIADAAGIPPLLSGLLAGVVIANLPEGPSRELESVLRRGETAGAILLYAVAGVLATFEPGWGAVLLALGLAASRTLLKTAWMSAALRGGGEELPRGTPLRLATVRQAPIAVAIAVSLVLVEDSQLSRTILSVVVLTGLLSSLVAPLRSLQRILGERRDERQGAAA
jgi:Kef-type K+ transport system membrane component KefB